MATREFRSKRCRCGAVTTVETVARPDGRLVWQGAPAGSEGTSFDPGSRRVLVGCQARCGRGVFAYAGGVR